MKNLLLIFIVLIFSKTHAQYSIQKDSILNDGIYKTFAEFRDNKPSIKLDRQIISKEVSYGGLGSSNSLTAYAIDIPKKEGREIGDVFGFCDGKNVYLITSEYTDIYFPNKIHNFNFSKVEYIGKYCYYDVIYFSHIGNLSIPSRGTNILKLNSGEIDLLTKSLLKGIIADNIELLERFKNQENKYQHLKEYLIEYLKN